MVKWEWVLCGHKSVNAGKAGVNRRPRIIQMPLSNIVKYKLVAFGKK